MRVLTVNAGSSSLKLRLVEDDDTVVHRHDLPAGAEGFGAGGFDADAVAAVVTPWPRPDAVAHRVVHGGTLFTGPVRVDADVRAQLAGLTDLAPLHQPTSLAGLDAVQAVFPDVPVTASFDTAFHATMPAAASTYAIPREWRERWAVRRYGFHGLSHAWCSARAAQLVDRPLHGLRIVTCHLGAGASLAAVLDGRSVDTTMGFTPLEGLVMATRSGSVDPGLVLWLAEHEHLAPHEIARALEERSGMLALAGTADMRAVTTSAAAGDEPASAALDVYVHRLVAGIAAMAAAAGGIDVLAFTGGVGENSAAVRARATAGVGFLGARAALDSDEAHGDRVVVDGPVSTVVVVAREDLQLAREARMVLEATVRPV